MKRCRHDIVVYGAKRITRLRLDAGWPFSMAQAPAGTWPVCKLCLRIIGEEA
jgi:hypothetical protein